MDNAGKFVLPQRYSASVNEGGFGSLLALCPVKKLLLFSNKIGITRETNFFQRQIECRMRISETFSPCDHV